MCLAGPVKVMSNGWSQNLQIWWFLSAQNPDVRNFCPHTTSGLLLGSIPFFFAAQGYWFSSSVSFLTDGQRNNRLLDIWVAIIQHFEYVMVFMNIELLLVVLGEWQRVQRKWANVNKANLRVWRVCPWNSALLTNFCPDWIRPLKFGPFLSAHLPTSASCICGKFPNFCPHRDQPPNMTFTGPCLARKRANFRCTYTPHVWY